MKKRKTSWNKGLKGFLKHTEATKKIISLTHKGKPSHRKGKKLPKDHIEKMKNSWRKKIRDGFVFSKKRNRMISKAKTGVKRAKWVVDKMKSIRGEKTSNWKGGKFIDGHGYVKIYKPDHPHCMNEKYVFEHRLIIENKIGRLLKHDEVVHHINENPSDNRISNLKLMSRNEHSRFHRLRT